MDRPETPELLRVLADNRFRFACHPGIDCFNACCADLRLILTPWDLLRLKRRLGLTAAEFQERHAEPEPQSAADPARLPLLRLKMRDDERRTCPFVTPAGCSVYPDRPAACRLYPLARASAPGAGPEAGAQRETYLLVSEAHCRGHASEREWPVADWLADQGLAGDLEWNRPWLALMSGDRAGRGALTEPQRQMFALASYNLERFRRFVLGTRFRDRFSLDPARLDRLEDDDEELLRLALEWLEFFLEGGGPLADQLGP